MLSENHVPRTQDELGLSPEPLLVVPGPGVDILPCGPREWQGAVDALTARVAILDETGRIIALNRAWRRFAADAGDGSGEAGVNYLRVCDAAPSPGAVQISPLIREVLEGQRDRLELEYPCPDAAQNRWCVLRAASYVGEGRVRIVVSHEDVTEHRRERERAALQSALLNEIDAAVLATDLSGTIIAWPGGAQRLFGWSSDEAVGRQMLELVFPPGTAEDPVLQALSTTDRWSGERLLVRKGGSTLPALVSTRTVPGLDGETTAIVGVALDLSERLKSERELMAMRDHLRAVTDSMGEGLYTLDHEGRVTYMNRAATEQLGWSLGDLAGRVLHDVVHYRRADGSPFPIEDCPISNARGIGKVVRVDDDVFLRADGTELPVAYTVAPFATDTGIQGRVVVFRDITERKAKARRIERELEELTWVKRIRDALTGDQFVLYAQPIVDLTTETVVQHELLLRMRDPATPDHIIAPGAFLPIAEEYGFIGDIDRWVIERAAQIASQGIPVELNVSAASIGDPALITYITEVIARTGADPTRMVFEITETTLVDAETAGRVFVERLHAIGCRVALDDFGTGYGGFTYLKQLPIDYLKIDIEFVRDLTHNPASRTVVEAIVKLAQGFGLKTVAEGVEDQPTLKLLRELEVDYAQGFLIGRPTEFTIVPRGDNPGTDRLQLDQPRRPK